MRRRSIQYLLAIFTAFVASVASVAPTAVWISSHHSHAIISSPDNVRQAVVVQNSADLFYASVADATVDHGGSHSHNGLCDGDGCDCGACASGAFYLLGTTSRSGDRSLRVVRDSGPMSEALPLSQRLFPLLRPPRALAV